MNIVDLQFAPLLPWPLLVATAALAVILLAYAGWRRARGAALRGLLALLLLLVLFQPVLREEQRTLLDDIALIIDDRTPSQNLDERRDQADAARAEIEQKLREFNNLSIVAKVIESDGAGSNIRPVIEQAMTEIDRQRLAGIIVITDGQLHDLRGRPAPPVGDAPVHALLTGRPDEIDRKLVVERAPTFAMVGEGQQLVLRVDELGLHQAQQSPVQVEVTQNGASIARLTVEPGVSQSVDFTLDKAGRALIQIEAAVREDELTAVNNQTTLTVNGIRDRLRVLLVSGRPYPGLRVWRNLLKADPAVDLVHFTILRPPEKQDGTPIRELALIAFPSHELFEEKIEEFDLVIFDRYSRRGLLPLVYLDNVARYVEKGGALLEAAGPEFAGALSLYRTPLARVLPGQPSGDVHHQAFKPDITELGLRHPVTRNLMAPGKEPSWGSWFRHVDVDVPDGQVVMSGVADRPLLALARVGDGRVAQLLSDHHWLWARGVDGGGPQGLLLRRLVHWLMKEPELEEEQLRVWGDDGRLIVERRSIDDLSVEATVTSPEGEDSLIELVPDAAGIARAEIKVADDGVYRIDDGGQVAFGMPRSLARAELEDLRATPEFLQPWIKAADGSSRFLAEEGVPVIRRVSAGRSMVGRGWLGLLKNERYSIQGLRETRLLPAWLALVVLLLLTALTWWREGRP